MIILLISVLFLFLGYALYSKYIEKVFGADNDRETPALSMPDGVDYMPLP